MLGGVAPIRQEYHLPKPAPGDGEKKRRHGGGQNKKRKHPFKLLPQDMMCQFTVRGEECNVLKCKKIHHKAEFMAKKGEDLGENCVLYSNFGKCIFGLTCRYGSSHLDSDFNNIVDEKLYEKMKVFEVQKTLLKELQQKLRSRKVWFGRSYQNFDENKIDYSDELRKHQKWINEQKRIRLDKSDENEPVSEPSDAPKNEISSSSLYEEIKDEYYCLKPREKRKMQDLRGKLFLSPLTTVGNLPFRRICKEFGADITCGEMALCEDLLQGNHCEWALLKRHHTEDIFGVQICGNHMIKTSKAVELISSQCDVDFIDLNVGCPIDLVFNRGAGSALMDKANRLEQILTGMVQCSDVPISVKMRIGTSDSKLTGLSLCERLKNTGISHITVHGRTRQQRYTKHADWDYIRRCKEAADPITLFGNGDVLSYEDYNTNLAAAHGVMIGRGALIKPWIFKEIKEQKHWDISSTERMEIVQRFVRYGLEHWGTDTSGVEKTRHFLLEWLSFLHRYIPVGVLEVLPQRINQRPPYYQGRDQLETLMCSDNAQDWVKISEIVLGKVPDAFNFVPKHIANSYN